MNYRWVKGLVLSIYTFGFPIEARPYKSNERNLDSRTASCHFVVILKGLKGSSFDPSNRSFFKKGNVNFIEDCGSIKVKNITFEE